MSLYSDFIQKPYAGLAKPSPNILAYSAPQAEILVVSTGPTVVDYPILRLRNSAQPASANGAGGGLFFEGLASNGAITALAAFRGTFIESEINNGIKSRLSLAVRNSIDNAAVNFSGAQPFSDLSPGNAASVALGTSIRPWAELWIGNELLTNYIRITPTGIISNNPSFVLGGSGGGSISLGTQTVSVGTPVDALACFSVGSLNTQVNSRGISVIVNAGAKTEFVAFASVYDVGTAGTRTAVSDFKGLSTGGAGQATTHATFDTGTPTWFALNRYGFYGNIAANNNQWNLFMASTAKNYIAGNTMLGVLGPGNALLEAETINPNQSVAIFSNSSPTPGGRTAVTVMGPTGTYYLLKVTSSVAEGSIVRFAVRADGKIMLGPGVPIDGAALTLAGRVSLTSVNTYDIPTTPPLSTTLQVTGDLGVADNQENAVIHVQSDNVVVAGTGRAAAFSAKLTVSSGVAVASRIRGANIEVSTSSAGETVAGRFVATGLPGHGGSVMGLQVVVTSQLTSYNSYGIQLRHSGNLSTGFMVQALVAGDQIGIGFAITSSSMLTNVAFTYEQRAGSPAEFLRYVNAAGVAVFRVNSLGQLQFDGAGRRIYGPMASAIWDDNLCFTSGTDNSPTYLGLLPSGSSKETMLYVSNNGSAAAAGYLQMKATATEIMLNAGKTGSAAALPLDLAVGGVYGIRLATNKDVILGAAGALTNMVGGYVFIPAISGPPTVNPVARPGYAAMIFDETNGFLYVHNGSWKKSPLFT